MAEVIDAKDQKISKAQAEKAGLVVTGEDIHLSDDSLTVSSDPAPAIAEADLPVEGGKKEAKKGRASKKAAPKAVAKKR